MSNLLSTYYSNLNDLQSIQATDINTEKLTVAGVAYSPPNLTNYVTNSSLASTLLSYLTTASASSTYETQSHASSTYATQSALGTVSGVASGAAALGATNATAIAGLVATTTAHTASIATLDGEVATLQTDVGTLQGKTVALSYSPATTSTTIGGAQLNTPALSSGNYSLNGTFNYNNSLTQAGVQPNNFSGVVNANNGLKVTNGLLSNTLTSQTATTALGIGRSTDVLNMTGSSININDSGSVINTTNLNGSSINIGTNEPLVNTITIGSNSNICFVNLRGIVSIQGYPVQQFT